MARRRERFERSDVPRERAHRNLIGLVVVIVVAVAVGFSLNWAWKRVQLGGNLEDAGLDQAVAAQASPTPPEGYVLSGHGLESVLFLAGASDGSQALESAQILVLDADADTGSLVSLPTNAVLTLEDGSVTTLGALYASGGAAACVPPLSSATNIAVAHVVNSRGDALSGIFQLQDTRHLLLTTRADDLLASLTTDMSEDQLGTLAEQVQAIGQGNLSAMDAPQTGEAVAVGDGSQTGVTVDKDALCVTLGLLTQAM